MSKTNLGLVAYAEKQIGKPYWYGCFGQTSTLALLNSKAKQYPSQYGGSRVSHASKNHIGKRVHDCVGLIKGYLWSANETAVPKYNSAQDVSANGMYSLCKKKGSISTMPDVKGVLVFMDKHVGVYVGNGYVVEAMGFDYGVKKTELKKRKWTKWGYCPFIEYVQPQAASKPATTKPTASKPATNTQQITAQTALKVGDKVKITGNYANSSVAKSAPNSKAKGETVYITKIYSGKAYPYQLGKKKNDTSDKNTIGFAKATSLKKA